MLRLTDFDGGGSIYLDPLRITGIAQLQAYSDQKFGFEAGRRTRVEYGATGMVLVQEAADDIASLVADAHGPSVGGGA